MTGDEWALPNQLAPGDRFHKRDSYATHTVAGPVTFTSEHGSELACVPVAAPNGGHNVYLGVDERVRVYWRAPGRSVRPAGWLTLAHGLAD